MIVIFYHGNLKSPSVSDKMLNISLDYVGTTITVKFNGDYLKEEKITFNHGKIINIYIVYKTEESVNVNSYPTLENYVWCS